MGAGKSAGGRQPERAAVEAARDRKEGSSLAASVAGPGGGAEFVLGAGLAGLDVACWAVAVLPAAGEGAVAAGGAVVAEGAVVKTVGGATTGTTEGAAVGAAGTTACGAGVCGSWGFCALMAACSPQQKR